MEIKEMTSAELEERKAQIATEVDAEGADLDALENEVRAIKEELETRKAEEAKKNEIRAAVANGSGVVIKETPKEESKMPETRDSKEYKSAFGEYIKKNYDLDKLNEEQRALLTVNATDGTVAVPVGVEQRINTAWENDEIMSRVIRTFFKGNLKVGYEASATGAEFHTEGGAAVTPETLVLNYVELIPEMAKKVVEVSDEVLAVNDTMVDYLYDEIEYQIIKLVAGKAVQKIVASSLTASHTLAGSAPTTADIVTAEGLLSGEAVNPVVITTRATAAAIKAEALKANYGFDPFDGMDVLYTEAANLGGASFIIADLSGVQANFPEGDAAKFKFDEMTKADADLVRIIGRLYVGLDVVAAGRAVKAVAGN